MLDVNTIENILRFNNSFFMIFKCGEQGNSKNKNYLSLVPVCLDAIIGLFPLL